MEPFLDPFGLPAAALAAVVLYGIYRGLRRRFPRLGRFRAGLIVVLGAVVLSALAASRFAASAAECLRHENTVLLRGERVIRLDRSEDGAPRPADGARRKRVLESCAFLADRCPLDGADATRAAAERICRRALAGLPLE